MQKGQISAAQLVFTLFLCRSFNLLSAEILNVTGHYGMEHIVAIPLALGIQALLAVPAFWLMKRNSRGMNESMLWTLGKAGILFPICSCIYLLLVAGITVYNLAAFLANAIYPGSSAIFFVITLIIAAMYAAYLGLEGIVRASVILFGALILSLTLTFVGVGERINLINIRPLMEGSMQTILGGSWRIVARSSTVYLFLLLCPKIRSHVKRGFIWYLAAVGILMETVAFFVSAVLGELAVREAYPFFMLTTIAQISIFQRMDALHVTIWVLVCLVRVAIFLWLMKEQFQKCLPLRAQQSQRIRYLLPFFSVLTAATAAVMVGSREAASACLTLLSSGIPVVLLMAGFPLVGLIVGEVRQRFQKRSDPPKEGART
ncbi:MAG: GerAB/ArcD/ProY family transporter [Candidatus Merdivicinus sp.]|jgi:hypothetical protein